MTLAQPDPSKAFSVYAFKSTLRVPAITTLTYGAIQTTVPSSDVYAPYSVAKHIHLFKILLQAASYGRYSTVYFLYVCTASLKC